jgi:hypothetical protein
MRCHESELVALEGHPRVRARKGQMCVVVGGKGEVGAIHHVIIMPDGPPPPQAQNLQSKSEHRTCALFRLQLLKEESYISYQAVDPPARFCRTSSTCSRDASTRRATSASGSRCARLVVWLPGMKSARPESTPSPLWAVHRRENLYISGVGETAFKLIQSKLS